MINILELAIFLLFFCFFLNVFYVTLHLKTGDFRLVLWNFTLVFRFTLFIFKIIDISLCYYLLFSVNHDKRSHPSN